MAISPPPSGRRMAEATSGRPRPDAVGERDGVRGRRRRAGTPHPPFGHLLPGGEKGTVAGFSSPCPRRAVAGGCELHRNASGVFQGCTHTAKSSRNRRSSTIIVADDLAGRCGVVRRLIHVEPGPARKLVQPVGVLEHAQRGGRRRVHRPRVDLVPDEADQSIGRAAATPPGWKLDAALMAYRLRSGHLRTRS